MRIDGPALMSQRVKFATLSSTFLRGNGMCFKNSG